MVRIVSDTSTLYSSKEAIEAGFHVSPLAVTIAGQTYREMDELRGDDLVKIIREGHMPRSSQPAVGEVMELYEALKEEEIINIAMADGLSGTYSSAVAAAKMADNCDRITVVNSRTLCGPHRYMVEIAAKLAAQGSSREEILEKLDQMISANKSYLLPDDFDYLRRGGRLSPLVSYVGKTIRLAPVLTQSQDGGQLVMASIKRNDKQAFRYLADELKKIGVGKGWRVYITHAAAPERANSAKEVLSASFPDAWFDTMLLTPAFITQGGPGCIAVQAIKEI